jgi:hypothetical protein
MATERTQIPVVFRQHKRIDLGAGEQPCNVRSRLSGQYPEPSKSEVRLRNVERQNKHFASRAWTEIDGLGRIDRFDRGGDFTALRAEECMKLTNFSAHPQSFSHILILPHAADI